MLYGREIFEVEITPETIVIQDLEDNHLLIFEHDTWRRIVEWILGNDTTNVLAYISHRGEWCNENGEPINGSKEGE